MKQIFVFFIGIIAIFILVAFLSNRELILRIDEKFTGFSTNYNLFTGLHDVYKGNLVLLCYGYPEAKVLDSLSISRYQISVQPLYYRYNIDYGTFCYNQIMKSAIKIKLGNKGYKEYRNYLTHVLDSAFREQDSLSDVIFQHPELFIKDNKYNR